MEGDREGANVAKQDNKTANSSSGTLIGHGSISGPWRKAELSTLQPMENSLWVPSELSHWFTGQRTLRLVRGSCTFSVINCDVGNENELQHDTRSQQACMQEEHSQNNTHAFNHSTGTDRAPFKQSSTAN